MKVDKNIPGTEGQARLTPKPWDYSCYLLLELKRAIISILDKEAKLLSAKSQSPQPVVVDFGCGTCPYEPLFTERSFEYIGADLRGNEQAKVQFAPGERLPFEDASVDVVFSSQVLEHVEEVQEYLNECNRILKPGGLLLLSTHGYWTYHGYPDDFYRWTFHGLKRTIEKAGFSVDQMIPCVGPLAYTTHLRNQLVRGFLYKFAPFSLPLIVLTNIVSALLQPLEDSITPQQVKSENAAVYAVEARKPSL